VAVQDKSAACGLGRTDLEELRTRGIDPAEIARQIARLRGGQRYAAIQRPCTVGDGIRRIRTSEVPALRALHAAAAAAGRFGKFVPASGAASRMFQELEPFTRRDGRALAWSEVVARAAGGEREASALTTFVQGLDRFAFYSDLRRILRASGERIDRLAREGRFAPILDALLDESGLGYARLPKALVKFHVVDGRARTALDEQLAEAAAYVQDRDGVCRVHLSVSPEHIERVRTAILRGRRTLGAALGVRYDAVVSAQLPSTDTVAVDGNGRPLRDARGRLVFRPGGHGALLRNLHELGGDLVYIKNIDNVQHAGLSLVTRDWKAILGGLLVQIERRAGELLERLRAGRARGGAVEQALRFTTSRLQVELDGQLRGTSEATKREWLIERLARPLRVCGMVRNTGEPGGGPFWVRGANGQLTNQIVETSQVSPDDAEAQAALARATHFNPVDLVCAVRDAAGRPYDLPRWADEDADLVSTKHWGGRPVRVLERPGLWNGAMAGWNSVFVEVPLATFSPVKSVLDLLRLEHQASGSDPRT